MQPEPGKYVYGSGGRAADDLVDEWDDLAFLPGMTPDQIDDLVKRIIESHLGDNVVYLRAMLPNQHDERVIIFATAGEPHHREIAVVYSAFSMDGQKFEQLRERINKAITAAAQ